MVSLDCHFDCVGSLTDFVRGGQCVMSAFALEMPKVSTATRGGLVPDVFRMDVVLELCLIVYPDVRQRFDGVVEVW